MKTYCGVLRQMTEKGLRMSFRGVGEIWLPKSRTKIISGKSTPAGLETVIFIPHWLAAARGLAEGVDDWDDDELYVWSEAGFPW